MPGKDRIVTIDFFPQSALRYLDHDAIVCIDVIRATTTLVTAVASGRRVFAAADFAEALRISRSLQEPVLAGSDEGLPEGSYELPNSPSAIGSRGDVWRPLVLVSSCGTRLLANARGEAAESGWSSGGGAHEGAVRGQPAVFVASLRNIAATAAWLSAGHARVAVLGACSQGGLRCEDQIAAARLGALLRADGFEPGSRGTAQVMDCWGEVGTDLIRLGRSAELLLQTGQKEDLDFILSHVDDLDFACQSRGAEICRPSSSVIEAARPPFPARAPERGPALTRARAGERPAAVLPARRSSSRSLGSGPESRPGKGLSLAR